MKRIKVIQFVYGLDDGGAETLIKDYASLIDKDEMIYRKFADMTVTTCTPMSSQ